MNWSDLSELSGEQPEHLDLARLQKDWLLSCLTKNRDSAYGRSHHFNKITSVTDYQKQVPVVDYEDLHPYIEDIANGQADILFSGTAVAFERTSGSTSAQKLIPYSTESLAQHYHQYD